MKRSRLLLLLAAPTALGLFVLACEDSESSPPPSGPDSSINIDGSTSDSQVPGTDATVNDSGGDGSDGAIGDAGAPCRFPEQFWEDGGIMLVPTPYRELADSPFKCKSFGSYYHVATFEDGGGLPPGTTGIGQAIGASPITDSVDGDDGFPDGAPPDSGSAHPCPTCGSWFNVGGTIDFTFSEATLGALPTHAGLVWTDDAVNATVTFTAYGADGGVIATQAVPGIGIGGISGETSEDRFFGVIFPGGVKRITMSHAPGGGIEIDHLQIGR